MTFTLRPYQRRCLRALATDFEAGHSSLLVQKATGTGKTVTFLAWLNEEVDDGRALILAHRSELITQPIAKARKFFPALAKGMGIVMADKNNADARVVVATVQTLNSAGRLDEVLSHGAITHYVVDEAHHDPAATYRAVEERLREENPHLLKTGWTATPTRTDGDGLVTVDGKTGPYDKMTFRYPIQQAIRDGALCEFSAFEAGVPVELSNIRETPSGWDDKALGDVLNAENVWDIVHDAWRGSLDGLPDCTDRPTIVFTASVAQAEGGAAYFRRLGVSAEHVSGETPRDERDAMLRRFKAGTTQIVANCNVLTEGFDAPNASCVLMVSPTKSPLVWTQKAGRVLRLDPEHPTKSAVIVDFYPTDRGCVFAADALGVPRAARAAREKAEEAGVLVGGGWSVDRFGRAVSIDTDRVVVRMLDLMARSRYPWTLRGHKATTAVTGERAACIVLPDASRLEKAEAMRGTDRWSKRHEALYEFLRAVRLYDVQREGYVWRARLVGAYAEADQAKAVVDEWSSDNQIGSRSARWRNKAASDKQARYLRRLMPDAPDAPTRGEASQLISEALAIQATEREEEQNQRELWRNA